MRVGIHLLFGITAFALSSFSVAEDQAAVSNVQITDLRTAADKEHHRAGISAVSFQADSTFKPQPVPQLKAKLEPLVTEPAKLAINEFRMIDFFPKRKRQAQFGLAGNAIVQALEGSKADTTVVANLAVPGNEDSVVCVLSGTLNDKPVSAAAFRVYRASAFAFKIHDTKEFVDAASGCIDDLAHQLSASLKPSAPGQVGN